MLASLYSPPVGQAMRRQALGLALAEACSYSNVSQLRCCKWNWLENCVFKRNGSKCSLHYAALCRAGQCTDRRFAWPWRRPADTLMCCNCDVAGEAGLKIAFVKRIEGNFHFTIKPSAGQGDAPIGAWPGLGYGNLIVHFHHVFPLHCHKLGRAFCFALAEANILFTCSLSLHCHVGLASVKSFHSTALYRTYNLFSLMTYFADLAIVRLIYSTALHCTKPVISFPSWPVLLALLRLGLFIA